MSDLSRRNLLKRLGVGTAVVWASPVVASVGAPKAFGQTTNPCLNAAIADFFEGGEGVACSGCFPRVVCGTTNNGFSCFCLIRTSNECCVCVEPKNCPLSNAPENTKAKPCNGNAQCDPGDICVHSCCNGSPALGMPRLIPGKFKGVCATPCANPGAGG